MTPGVRRCAPVLLSTVFLWITLSACRSGEGVTLAQVGITDTLPGAPRFDGELSRTLAAAWEQRPADYELHTRYVRTDQTPIYLNRLFLEASPHLNRHAHTPVNWFRWGDEAFETARVLARPVLLSIGFGACDSCDLMQAESFDDEDVALYLNEYYVSVKVDRAERPDLEAIYLPALRQFTRGRVGWPMTLWLTSAREPYGGGTYYPPGDTETASQPGFLAQLRRMRIAHDAGVD